MARYAGWVKEHTCMGGLWQTVMHELCSSAVDALLSDAMLFAAQNTRLLNRYGCVDLRL